MRRSNLKILPVKTTKKIKLDKNTLYRLYVEEKKSSITISKELGISISTVYSYLKKYSIPTRSLSDAGTERYKDKYGKITKEVLYQMYVVDGKSSNEIAKLFNVNHKTILKRLIQYDIPIRTGSEALTLKYNSKTKSSKNKLERNRTKYKNWRKKCLVRDDFTCQACGKNGGKLNVHHINNFSEFKEFRYKPSNGITLCKECHTKFHSMYGARNNTKGQLEEFINFVKYGVRNEKD
jgi:DNA-binding CsgD family transcriptional regulator